jgi:hypothetical protein
MDRGVGAAVRPLPESDRKDLAIQALAGSETVSDLAARRGVSRKFVYQQTYGPPRLQALPRSGPISLRQPIRSQGTALAKMEIRTSRSS